MPTDHAFLARVRIEPLDRKIHDRAAFSCGERRIDNFIKNTATRLQDDDLTRAEVACLDASHAVIGFYSINNHAVDVSALQMDVRKKLPRHDTLGAIYLSMLGVHENYQCRGLGKKLMKSAFTRCIAIADLSGAYYLVLDALDENAASLYRSLGFEELPSHPNRMLITIKTIRAARSVSKANVTTT
jgi:ribosomal protein S18 acetylase RimI-like enzyme